MQKSLEQIQKENRKFILSALEGVDGSLSKDLFNSKPLTLSRVLLAFKNKEVKTCYGDEAIFNIGLVDFYEIESGAYRENHHFEYICDWDLKKETLEEQTEETQRGLNKFFNN